MNTLWNCPVFKLVFPVDIQATEGLCTIILPAFKTFHQFGPRKTANLLCFRLYFTSNIFCSVKQKAAPTPDGSTWWLQNAWPSKSNGTTQAPVLSLYLLAAGSISVNQTPSRRWKSRSSVWPLCRHRFRITIRSSPGTEGSGTAEEFLHGWPDNLERHLAPCPEG